MVELACWAAGVLSGLPRTHEPLQASLRRFAPIFVTPVRTSLGAFSPGDLCTFCLEVSFDVVNNSIVPDSGKIVLPHNMRIVYTRILKQRVD